MRRPDRLAATIAGTWVLMLSGCDRQTEPSRATPQYSGPIRHVVLVSFDTTRADHFGCYGNPWIQTPSVDAFAAEGILFEDHLTAATSTLASHTSMMTGKYPQAHGVPRNGFVVHADNLMLAEILRDAGFETAGFLGSFALESRFNFNQGFTHWDERFDILANPGIDQNQRTATSVTDAVLAWLDAEPLPEHLFLFVHYFDPHTPYAPPSPFDTLYGDSDVAGKINADDHPALRNVHKPEELRSQLYHYAGEVSYLDSQFGRLIAELRRRDILDSAIVILTSDHGEQLSDTPAPPFDHGLTVYNAEARTLWITRLPRGESGGSRYAGLSSATDVLPTLLAFLELAIPSGVAGQAFDLTELKRPNSPRICFSTATKPWWDGVETDDQWLGYNKSRGVRRGQYKFIRTRYDNREELFDLARDPLETTNLLDAPAPVSTRIASELRAELDAFEAMADPLPARFDPSQEDETRRRLRSLGYLRDPDDG